MTVEGITTLFDYGYWANAGLRDVVSRLTTEQFTGHVAGSYGSIRNTMVHMLSAEWGWLERCGGAGRGPALNAQDYPAATSLFDRWHDVEARVREFLSTLTTRISRVGWSLRSGAAPGSRWPSDSCCITRPFSAFTIADRWRCS